MEKKEELKSVSIWTDGACAGNPGPGGWGALLIWNHQEEELWGGEAHTTNNRMELLAAIMALESLTEKYHVVMYVDSQYVRNGITIWMTGWKKNGWRTAGRGLVKNQDLWQRLDAATIAHDVHWHWVKGHAGDVNNERADILARNGIKSYQNKGVIG